MIRKSLPVALSLSIALAALPVHKAHAGFWRKMAAAGVVTEGVIYAEAYDAVAAAATGVGMAECARKNCVQDAVQKLIHILRAHPLIGHKAVEKALVNYTTKHPEETESVENVRSEIGLSDNRRGNCDQGDYNELVYKVNALCKNVGKTACKYKHGDDPADLMQGWIDNRNKIQRCINARDTINHD